MALVNNGGLVSGLSGVLSLDGGGSSAACAFNAGSGSVLNFGGGAHLINAGTSFTGGGLHRINNSGAVNFAAPITIAPSFELASNGILDGTHEVLFAGPFTWSGGTMQGAGKTTFTNTASVNVTSGNTKALIARTIDHYTSNAVWSVPSTLNAGFGPTWIIRNGGVLDLQADASVAYAFGGAMLSLNNAGTLKKSLGLGNATFVASVTNSGAVRAQSGTLDFPTSYVQVAGVTELAGGNFAGTLLDIQGGLLTGTGNIAANVRNAAQVAPGTGVGLMTLPSPRTYTSTTNSLLTLQIGGLTLASGHDQLRLNNGTATLAGTLRAELANGHIPTAGNVYTVMTFTARSGTFTNFSFPDYEFGVLQTATEIILIASNALPAVQLSGVPSNQLVCVPFVLQTAASDLDGTVTNLSVFVGANRVASFPNGASREVTISYDFPGNATFIARATDDKGAIRETNLTTLYFTLPRHVLNLGGVDSNDTFKICMLGEVGSNYVMLASTNVALPPGVWTVLGLMENTNGIRRYLDTGTLTNRPRRYYRALQVP